jgi:hypothetical protein
MAAGCASMAQRRLNAEGLREAVGKFNDAIRWRDYQQAILWVSFEQQEEFWRRTEALQSSLRIVDYQVQHLQVDAGSASGSVTLRYRFYRVQNPQVRSLTVYQRWHYVESETNWRIVQSGLATLEEERF